MDWIFDPDYLCPNCPDGELVSQYFEPMDDLVWVCTDCGVAIDPTTGEIIGHQLKEWES